MCVTCMEVKVKEREEKKNKKKGMGIGFLRRIKRRTTLEGLRSDLTGTALAMAGHRGELR